MLRVLLLPPLFVYTRPAALGMLFTFLVAPFNYALLRRQREVRRSHIGKVALTAFACFLWRVPVVDGNSDVLLCTSQFEEACQFRRKRARYVSAFIHAPSHSVDEWRLRCIVKVGVLCNCRRCSYDQDVFVGRRVHQEDLGAEGKRAPSVHLRTRHIFIRPFTAPRIPHVWCVDCSRNVPCRSKHGKVVRCAIGHCVYMLWCPLQPL